jgi:type IV pilus assembly protein PilO
MEFLGVEFSELEISKIGSWPRFLQIILFVLCGVLAVILAYFLDISEKLAEYQEINNQIREKSHLFSDAQAKAVNLDAYKNEVTIVKKQLALLSEELPKKNELAGFLDDASQQAGITGLKFSAIQPMAEVNKGFYSEADVALKMTGNYTTFSEFARNISNMKRIVTIHDFEIKKIGNSADVLSKATLSIDFLSKTYWAAGNEKH